MKKNTITPTPIAKDTALFTLENGLRIIHRMPKGARLVHCGLVFDVGSRDEPIPGMAHFIEHMLFKGTESKSVLQVLNRLDIVGGELNAFTTKEKTCLHATVTKQFYARAIELLTDMAFRSIFPAEEIEKEKTVIADEIEMYKDNPEEAITDDFDGVIFPGHPLGNPTLGTRESIREFTRENLMAFYRQYYTPSQAVISVIGSSPFTLTEKIIRELKLSEIPNTPVSLERTPPKAQMGERKVIPRPLQQTHLVLGASGYPVFHPYWPALNLLINYLGGPFMNSRLNVNIREKYGLTYNLYAYYSPFSDSGIWGIYAGCEPAMASRALDLIQEQLLFLQKEPLHPKTLDKIKRQYLGYIEISQENQNHMILQQARDLQALGRIQTLEEYSALVQAITPEELHKVACEALAPEKLSLLQYQPTN
jgi:predicted Zn-dependent peptidase